MKKIVLSLAVLLSLTTFANSKEDSIEMGLMKKFPALTDGTTTINVHEYDVDLDHHKIEVKVELKGDALKAEYDKLDKAKLETLASEMAKYTQTESGKNLPVQFEIELDKDMLPDEVLYKNTF
ncbi:MULTISPECIES: hypothetical protein [Cetobacterium]|jgi:hypothetical protein|uniref:Uncharacterized protein n=1 Tax=Candidatus Cetobacterium colombiensis TaxID=3073100 RepID=A0ABU4W900_9FUSO|nr:hypothetical protein [Candidatus Cetobacterium colombiensis]MDX8335630.1 hypothetical protein [Candidatus Cetobacterium colombiensis]